MKLLATTIARTLGQLGDTRLWLPLGLGLATSAVLLVALWYGIDSWLAGTELTGIGWLDDTLHVAGGFAVVVLSSWLLFPVLAPLTVGLYLDLVAGAVERRYYPQLPEPKGASFWGGILAALRFAGFSLVANLLALPLYFVPGLNIVLFVVLNGVLIGREYFEMAAVRRRKLADARALLRTNRGKAFLHGAAISALFAVPVVNIAAPVLAAALFTHLYTLVGEVADARA